MNNKEMVNKIRGKGYFIPVNQVDFRIQDCTNWYDCENPILKVISLDINKKTLELLCVGDIRIYGKKKTEFVYKGGNPSGELTKYLKKHGEWHNNNWFEITENGSADLGDVFYDLDSAVKNLLSRL